MMNSRGLQINKADRTTEAEPEVVSTIRITFEGMMILIGSDDRPSCEVGILEYAPNHTANLLITKIRGYGAPENLLHLNGDEFESRMWLDVEKFESHVILFKDISQPFNRAADQGNPRDFRWALDFEGDEMYQVKTSVDPAGFKSILRINDGIFYTQQRSANKLVKKPWKAPAEVLGRVAVKLRADIALYDEYAYFQNGVNGKPVELRPETGIDYGIYISHTRAHHGGGEAHAASDEIDAENYNYVVAIEQPFNRKIHFDRAEQRIDPDAVCLIPTMSQTELPPN